MVPLEHHVSVEPLSNFRQLTEFYPEGESIRLRKQLRYPRLKKNEKLHRP